MHSLTDQGVDEPILAMHELRIDSESHMCAFRAGCESCDDQAHLHIIFDIAECTFVGQVW